MFFIFTQNNEYIRNVKLIKEPLQMGLFRIGYEKKQRKRRGYEPYSGFRQKLFHTLKNTNGEKITDFFTLFKNIKIKKLVDLLNI